MRSRGSFFRIRVEAQGHRGAGSECSREKIVGAWPRIRAALVIGFVDDKLVLPDADILLKPAVPRLLDRNHPRLERGLTARASPVRDVSRSPGAQDFGHVSRVLAPGEQMIGALQGKEALRMPGSREDRRRVIQADHLVGWRMKDEKRLLHRGDPVVQPRGFDILQKLALDRECSPGERHGSLALVADLVQLGSEVARHMRGIRGRADGCDSLRLRNVACGGQHRRAAKAMPDENIDGHQGFAKVLGRGKQILHVGGKVRIREFALAHAEAREIEAEDGKSALGEFARDPRRGV